MRFASELGPLPITLMVSLLVAVILLAIRVFVQQRVQQRWQRENRQQTECLKSLVVAYRSLAGSFSPATKEHGSQLEETLADIVLFGSLNHVALAARCVECLKRGETVDYQPLIESLRNDLRAQLGLEPIPQDLVLPASGPGKPMRPGRGGDGEGGGGGGRGGGGGGGGSAAGGFGAGLMTADTGPLQDQP